MSTIIICEQCGDARNAAYKNTKYCVRCALLRDLTFVGTRSYGCELCDRDYAPVALRDPHCGDHAIGCGKYLPCAICQAEGDSDADGYFELHRAGLPVCVRCVRDPARRQTVIRALRRGQAAAREKNGLAVRVVRERATQKRRPSWSCPAILATTPEARARKAALLLSAPKNVGEGNIPWLQRLIAEGVIDEHGNPTPKEA